MILAMMAIGLALSDDSNRKEEAVRAQTIIDAGQDTRIEHLEKEIRLLKTDLMLLQNCDMESEKE